MVAKLQAGVDGRQRVILHGRGRLLKTRRQPSFHVRPAPQSVPAAPIRDRWREAPRTSRTGHQQSHAFSRATRPGRDVGHRHQSGVRNPDDLDPLDLLDVGNSRPDGLHETRRLAIELGSDPESLLAC